MRSALIATTTLVLLGLACGRGESTPRVVGKAELEGAGEGEGASPARPTKQPDAPRKLVEAAGLRLPVPVSWELLADDDPNFALAVGPSALETQTMSCVIELRRQGEGPLASGAKRTLGSRDDDLSYRQGQVRGRVRRFEGPTPESARIVHCRGPRGSSDWAVLDASLAALSPHADASLPAPAEPGPSALVELCTATRVRKTQVCVRRSDGAVYCGASEGDRLARVAGLPPATDLGCDGLFSCARADTGALWCWQPEQAPVEVRALGEVRAVVGGCVVSEAGKLSCRSREAPGPSLDGFTELVPFGQGEHALRGVSQVMAGTNPESGCVVAEGALRCWDRVDSLALRLDAADGRAPQVVETFADPEAVTGLAAVGPRVCVARGPGWTCLAGDERYELDSCGARPCGCLLTGLSSFSCEHEPHARLDARSFGHVGGVRAVDGACAVLADDRVICRGPITGQSKDAPELAALVTGTEPGVLHLLALDDG